MLGGIQFAIAVGFNVSEASQPPLFGDVIQSFLLLRAVFFALASSAVAVVALISRRGSTVVAVIAIVLVLAQVAWLAVLYAVHH